ncbi:MAG: hypothetical protein JWO36_1281 [Myxococcales bacterium]|nr:hypothetical protein [Myxococcales bacterium]
MWLLFHRKAGTKVVQGGESFTEDCPTCARQTRFEEIEQTERVGVWFIDVASEKHRAYRCRVCGDVFDLRETNDDEPVSKPERSGMLASDRASQLAASQLAADRAQKLAADRIEKLAAEQRRRDAELAARETRIEDELAELKRRMGR